MADVLNQIVEKVKESNNILVTVSANPSVDELSAALGITLLINKLNKHATAVFSGAVPPAIKFLQPEKTFESTVDSLRDFIIALDKEKADHLRYKIVDDMVKIFITPYRTTINQKDLDFSQGDYNVEMVLAIGVKDEADLDHALESHGRILHDAVVASVSLGESTQLGSLEWSNPRASCYSEVLCRLANELRGESRLIDEQIATAFLTGIVAATDRFSNAHTSSAAMTVAAQLMADGANQQLIATKLKESHDKPIPVPEAKSKDEEKSSKKDESKNSGDIGALSISHEPVGDVDDVKNAIDRRHSDEALRAANEELEKRSSRDAAAAAEKKLAEQLASIPAVEPEADRRDVPSVADLQRDIAASSAEVDEAAKEDLALPPVAPFAPGPGLAMPVSPSEPSIGGTFNATTEQAAEEARKAEKDMHNRVILSHDRGAVASQPPSMQSPFNAVADKTEVEPTVRDVLSEVAPVDAAPEAVSSKGITVQPNMPAMPAPSVEAAPAANPASSDQDQARSAVDAALSAASAAPSFGAVDDLPPLPPLPPLPDFSSLPPVPANGGVGADTLESTLPPPPAPAVSAPTSNDPAQFKIPGQA